MPDLYNEVSMNTGRKFKIAAFGEVLWDLLPDASVLGGAPFNFTYRINSLDNEGVMISAVGKDFLGEKALKAISALQISDRYIQINPEYPTGTVNVFFDEFKNPDYEIIKGVAYDFVTFNEKLERLISQVDCICFGTLAQRNSVSKQTLQNLLQHFRGKYRLYDLNLRKECYSIENIISSLKTTDILKLNEQEANKLNNLLQLNKKGLVEICTELINSYRLQYCVITLEERGSLAVSVRGEVVYTPGFKVNLTDPLGAGDAFSAAFVNSLLRGKSLREAGESGNQLGALVATKKGATQKIAQDELNNIALENNRIFDQNFSNYINLFYL
jgi:fructokinase